MANLLDADWSGALKMFELSNTLLNDGGVNSYEVAEILLRKAEAYNAMDNYDNALRQSNEALELLDRPGEGLERGHVYRQRGIAHYWVGQVDSSEQDFNRSETELRKVGDRFELAHLLCDRAEYITADAARCLTDAQEALALFEKMDLPDGVARATELRQISRDRLRNQTSADVALEQAQLDGDTVIGSSQIMRELIAHAVQIAPHSAPVLITGETGTGKEVIARLIHEHSSRGDQPLIAINCAALPENIIERELFGNAKGAYTGADQDRPGFVEAADGGTLFLDELGDLPLPMQAKLLRLLQDGSYRRVGEVTERKASLRVIAATNQELKRRVDEGAFREDVFYRLSCFELDLPALRERGSDLELLVQHFLKRESTELGVSLQLDKGVLAALRHHRWPGNVRELEMAIKRASALGASEGRIRLSHLPVSVRRRQQGGGSAHGESLNLKRKLEGTERSAVLEALQLTGFRREEAAKLLGIGRNTLYDKMKRLGIKPQKGGRGS